MNADKAARMVAVAFLSRDVAHREHLRTTSYAAHEALEAFYEDVVGVADAFAEAYQGRNGPFLTIPLLDIEAEGDIADVLDAHMRMIEAARDEAVGEDRPIQNRVDELVGVYLRALYMLRNLL